MNEQGTAAETRQKGCTLCDSISMKVVTFGGGGVVPGRGMRGASGSWWCSVP